MNRSMVADAEWKLKRQMPLGVPGQHIRPMVADVEWMLKRQMPLGVPR